MMDYLVDTNVFCEQLKKKPDPKVIRWLEENESQLYISTVTIAEIRRGIERLPGGKRKDQFAAWLQEVCHAMKGTILSFNRSVANIWGPMQADLDRRGIVLPPFDGMIAATASRYDLTVATRNTRDFAQTSVKLVGPFAG